MKCKTIPRCIMHTPPVFFAKKCFIFSHILVMLRTLWHHFCKKRCLWQDRFCVIAFSAILTSKRTFSLRTDIDDNKSMPANHYCGR